MQKRTIFTALTVTYISTIYLTSGFAREAATVLRHVAGHKLNFLTTSFLAAIICGFLIVRRNLINRDLLLPLAGILCGYGLAFYYLRVPEERWHLLQYGIPCYLCTRALPERLTGTCRSLLVIFIITLAGIGDELIQALRPNRVCDVRDILINAYSALLAQALLMILERKKDNPFLNNAGIKP